MPTLQYALSGFVITFFLSFQTRRFKLRFRDPRHSKLNLLESLVPIKKFKFMDLSSSKKILNESTFIKLKLLLILNASNKLKISAKITVSIMNCLVRSPSQSSLVREDYLLVEQWVQVYLGLKGDMMED